MLIALPASRAVLVIVSECCALYEGVLILDGAPVVVKVTEDLKHGKCFIHGAGRVLNDKVLGDVGSEHVGVKAPCRNSSE